MTVSTKPHRNTRLAQFVTRRVLELKHRKAQAQIAAEAGFVNANMLSMIKGGSAKLALDRVPALAEALECDAARLFRVALEQMLDAAVNKLLHAPTTKLKGSDGGHLASAARELFDLDPSASNSDDEPADQARVEH